MSFLRLVGFSGHQQELQPETSGIINTGFQELVPASFLRPPGNWQLFIDDAPLPAHLHNGVASWLWSPEFYAGTVRAEIIAGGERSGITYLLDVSPDPKKVGQEIFKQMVTQVQGFDPDLVLGDQPATTPIGNLGERENIAVRYMRLARHASTFAIAAARMSRQPHRSIRAARRHVPLYGVRSVDMQTVLATIAGGSISLLADVDEAEAPGDSGRQPLFDVPFSEETFDSSANRTMAALLMHLAQCVDDVAQQLETQISGEPDEQARAAFAQRWPRRNRVLDDLKAGVKSALGRSPLKEVTRREISAAGLTAIAAHPLYARLQQLVWAMLRPGYEGGQLLESSAMSPTWAIYEAWCFVQLVAALKSKLLGWAWGRIQPSQDCYQVLGTKGDNAIRIHFQKPFSYSEATPKSGLWSVSAHLIPDIVLVIQTAKAERWVILDAKYRRGRSNVLDGMRSAHVYRDALRRFDKHADLSLLLIPAAAQDAAWLQTKAFRDRHGVGAIVLSPTANSNDVLSICIEELLD